MQIFDFYYSEKQAEITRRLSQGDRRHHFVLKLYNGQEYTECVSSGGKPMSVWDDLTFLGSGTIEENVKFVR